MASMSASQPLSALASGAHPASTFPNCYSMPQVAARTASSTPAAAWAAPYRSSPLTELRRAVHDEDWERTFEEGLTKICMRGEWSANDERCSFLQCLVTVMRARRVLEVGSFCGVGTLALAEAISENGEVLALELDPYVVNLGRKYQMRSTAGPRIKNIVGPAKTSLEHLVDEAKAGRLQPFDLVVIDADKEGMREYFNMIMSTPGLLGEKATVCVDLTPYKGQAPKRYARFGFPYRWQGFSGQEEIDALRAEVREHPELAAHEVDRFLVVQKKAAA